MEIIRIHHIDYVVKDLGKAMAQYERLFRVKFEPPEALANRGVQVARFKLGRTWIALVQPTRHDSPVQQLLDHRGEGFFHIAYEVSDVLAAAESLKSRGVGLVNELPRRGLEGWKLVDIEPAETFGVETQLVQRR
jgi:methylmalonyl-CoA/ethylmalonyl-CoA epimerase